MGNEITFIIPSINRPTLKRSIDSLLSQTNPNWKCVIIYDGVEGSYFEDTRIKTITIEKTGVMSVSSHGQSGLVRNSGLVLCDTNWIGFLDDDDTLHPDYVNLLFEKYSDYDFVVWRMKEYSGKVIPRFDYEDLDFGNIGISFCYKNKFDNLIFDNNRDGEDFDFITKLKKLSSNYIITPEIYYNIKH